MSLNTSRKLIIAQKEIKKKLVRLLLNFYLLEN